MNPPGKVQELVSCRLSPHGTLAHHSLAMFTQAIVLYIQLFGRLLKGLSISAKTETSVDLLSSDVQSFFGVQGQILEGGELRQLLHSS